MIKLAVQELYLERVKGNATFRLHIPFLELIEKRIVAVVGQSGCGKSTLLDMLALILKPNASKKPGGLRKMDFQNAHNNIINLLEANAAVLASIRCKELGYVLQSGGLLPFLNVQENILLPAKLTNCAPKETAIWFDELVTTLGIQNHIYDKPQKLSGGQRQRVAIARALIHRPSIVLADEPTAAVDSENAKIICELLKNAIHACGAAAVIVSHDHTLMLSQGFEIAQFSLQVHGEFVNSTLLWPEYNTNQKFFSKQGLNLTCAGQY